MGRSKRKNPSDSEPQTLWMSEEAAHISVEKQFGLLFFFFLSLAFWLYSGE